jgi:integrase
LGKFVRLTRTLFAFGYAMELLDVPVRYGESFNQPPKRSLRLARQRRGERLVEPSDAKKLLDSADLQLKAMILLGLNCGFGQTDVATLNRSALSRPGWVQDIRPKTATPRRSPLWAETVEALLEVARVRPDPAKPEDKDAVFLTVKGNRWLRFNDRGTDGRGVTLDAVAGEFGKLCRRCGVAASFYYLRHSFRTAADELPDRAAIRLVMGHADGDVDDFYRERISDERLLAVTNHVRNYYLGRTTR